MATSHENGLAKSQTRLLYAVCACNYLRLPLARQHKPSIFVSRFAPSRHFFYMQSVIVRSLSPARHHRLTVINTDRAQTIIKKISVPHTSLALRLRKRKLLTFVPEAQMHLCHKHRIRVYCYSISTRSMWAPRPWSFSTSISYPRSIW